jgi:hypothetical protein
VRDPRGDFQLPRDSHLAKEFSLIKFTIEELGRGVMILVREATLLPPRSGEIAGTETTIRNYGAGAQILLDLGVRDMVLLRLPGR